jgi:hypothetical protein
MKTRDKQEILLTEYFKKYQVNIADDGFTSKVMSKIPKRGSIFSPKDILITISLIIGSVFSIPALITNIFASQNIYVLLFILCCFAGIILSIIIATDPENELI